MIYSGFLFQSLAPSSILGLFQISLGVVMPTALQLLGIGRSNSSIFAIE